MFKLPRVTVWLLKLLNPIWNELYKKEVVAAVKLPNVPQPTGAEGGVR